MKTCLLALTFAASFPMAASVIQTPPDTIRGKDLQEVVVEGKDQYTTARKSVYTPNSKQKNSSADAIDLLSQMGIPQLMPLTPGETSVKTLTNQPVVLYIDYLPATDDDISGMRMADVKRVEYYDFPDDPRFGGSQHVVNYIMAKYEWGGYTKLTASEWFINPGGRYALYSRFQYKRMTFDVSAGTLWTNHWHGGQDISETYRLRNADGTPNVVERISTQDRYHKRRNSYWPSFRATYNTDKVSISNIIFTSFSLTPHDNSAGTLRYVPDEFQGNSYANVGSGRYASVMYQGNFNFILNDKNIINFLPQYINDYTRSSSLYTQTPGAVEISNDARDRRNNVSGKLSYTHKFGKGGTLAAHADFGWNQYRTRYSGSASETVRNRATVFYPDVTYTLGNDRFYLYAKLGANLQWIDIDGTKVNHRSPVADVSFSYSPNRQHSIEISGTYGQAYIMSSLRSDVVIERNPLLYITGNPSIVAPKDFGGEISYTWLPNNNFNMGAYYSAHGTADRYVYGYVPYGDHALLRTVESPCGSSWQMQYGVNATLRLFNRSLSLSARAGGHTYHTDRPFDWSRTAFNLVVNVRYYIGNWSMGAYYIGEQRELDNPWSSSWSRTKDSYGISASWGNGPWYVGLSFSNFARWNWRQYSNTTRYELYETHSTGFGASCHAGLSLTATYTIGYGKQINRRNELSGGSSGTSGILQ